MMTSAAAMRLLDVARRAGMDLAQKLDGSDDGLRPTDIAQPALVFTECVLSGALDRGDVIGVAGHSVGEFAACVAAGALTPDDAIRLVVARGRAMAAMREGTMAAFIGLDSDVVDHVCAEAQQHIGEVVVIANFNAPGQVVVSGTVRAVDAATALAKERGLRRAIPLNVSGAFHSPLMADAASSFERELDAVTLRDPDVPVVCNVDAAPVRDAAGLRERLRRQLTSPVRWVGCVRALLSLGADTLIEVGPGSVLTGLARRIAPDVRALTINKLEEAEQLPAVLAKR